MANPVAGIDIVARLDQFRADLAAIPDIGGDAAKDLARKLSKEIKAAEKAAKDAAKAGKAMGDSYRQAGDVFGKVGQNSSKLAGLLSLVSPEAAEIARTFNDIGDGGEAATAGAEAMGVSLGTVGAALGAVAVVAGAAYLAWKTLHEEEERDARITATIVEARGKLKALFAEEAAAQVDLRVAAGELSEEEGKALKKRMGLHEQVSAALAVEGDKIKELEAANASWKATLADSLPVLTDVVGALTGVSGAGLAWALDGVTASTAENNAEIAKLDKAQQGLATEAKAATDVVVAGAAAHDKHAAAVKEDKSAADEFRRSLERLKRELDAEEAAAEEAAKADEARAKATRGMFLSSQDREHAALQERLHGIELLESRRGDEMRNIEQTLGAQAKLYEAGSAAQLTLTEQARKEELAINAKYDGLIAESRTSTQVDTANNVLGYVQQATGALSESLDASYAMSADMVARLQDQLISGDKYYTTAQKAELKKREKAARDQALAQFEAAKHAKAAEATASMFLAGINAIAQSPPPSPFGLIGAGIAMAAGLASIAAIESTQMELHGGGPTVNAPDEVNIKARRGEFMLNPNGTSRIGEQAARAANAGMSSGGGAVFVVNQYQHSRQVTRYKQDALLRNDPIAQLFAAGKLVGQEAS